jgi:periplasmic copper chaperone A
MSNSIPHRRRCNFAAKWSALSGVKALETQMNADVAQMAADENLDGGSVDKRAWARDSLRFYLRPSAPHLRSSAFPMIFAGVVIAATTLHVEAAVTATDAWVRGTVPAQKTTGAFITLESSEDAKLISVTTPAAKISEIHESTQSQGVMHMHAVDQVPLPAGKRVELKPGGFHVMLVDLAKPLGEGDSVPLTLTIEDKQGKRSELKVQAPVRPLGK